MMKDLISRTSMLEEILEVEVEIKQIMMNPTYMKIVHNLKQLNRMGFSNSVMMIPSPDDLNKNLEVRIHSKKINEIRNKYEKRQLEYEQKINDLLKHRNNLEKQLFRKHTIL